MARNKKPDIVSREKASSHPIKPGRFYSARVTFVGPSGQVNIHIQDLVADVGPVIPVGTTPLNKLVVGDEVVCTFTDEFINNIIVFGSKKIKQDIFASKQTVQALQAALISLEARVSALEAE